MFSGDFAYADHPDSIGRDGLVVEGRVHEDTGAGWWSLVAFGGYRVVRFQQGLGTNEKITWSFLTVLPGCDGRDLLCLCVYLKVWLTEYAGKFMCCLALLGERCEIFQDVLHQFHVVLPHCLQLRLLELLVGLFHIKTSTQIKYEKLPKTCDADRWRIHNLKEKR